MKRILTIALLTAWLGSIGAAAPAEGLKVGSKAPNFTLKTLAGKSYQLANYQGKRAVLLDFGRFTCLPCRDMLTDLQKLQVKYKGQQVQIFSLNLDGGMAPRAVPKGLKELGITFPVLPDPGAKVSAAYQVTTIPHLVLIDKQGIVRFTHTGYEAGVRATLEALIAKH